MCEEMSTVHHGVVVTVNIKIWSTNIELNLLLEAHICNKMALEMVCLDFSSTVVPGLSVLGFRALPGCRALCTGNQIWTYVINLPGFSAFLGFKAPFHGDGQSALNPGTTVHSSTVFNS